MKRNVLIFENDEDIRNIVGFILESEGYKVLGCDCHIKNLAAYKPDLILLDEWINNKEGHMLCKEIKAIKDFAHVPVVIFSTAMDIEAIAVTCQADDFVRKPFDIDILIEKVKRFLPLDQITQTVS